LARDTNFYYSFLVLPAEKRRAIIAVWDFCRAVDDAVDEAQGVGARKDESAREEIASWRRELAACFDGGVPETRQGQALVPMIRRFDLPREPFEALIEGVEMDLGSRRYETFPDLYEYCIRVASAVGLICLNIFGYRDPKARQYAVDLGVALQLTNILRDVKKDLALGRVYIPVDDMARFGVTEDMLVHDTASPNVRALLRAHGARARDYYGRATRAIPPDESRRLIAAEIMSGIYQAILAEIERRDFDVFGETIRVSRPRRAWIALSIWARMTFRVREAFAEVSREVSRRFGGPM
jgi:phytoene synthase